MVTGDNVITACAIAKEAGIFDDTSAHVTFVLTITLKGRRPNESTREFYHS